MSRVARNVALARLRALQSDASIQTQPKLLSHYFGGLRPEQIKKRNTQRLGTLPSSKQFTEALNCAPKLGCQ